MNLFPRVRIYDTTLRDSVQRHGISCSLEDKIKNIHKLADLGIPFIEAGWPGANSIDTQLSWRTAILTDYKVRVLNSDAGIAANNIWVLVESSNGERRWLTIGVSANILEASYQAVADGIEYACIGGCLRSQVNV